MNYLIVADKRIEAFKTTASEASDFAEDLSRIRNCKTRVFVEVEVHVPVTLLPQ